MRVGFRTKLFAAIFALVSCAIGLSIIVLSHFLSEKINADLEKELLHVVGVSATAVERVRDAAAMDPIAHALGERSEAQITVISGDGTVVGDSELSPAELATLENHAGRAEIVAAIRDGTGVSRRFSTTIGREMLYVARRAVVLGEKGCVRASRPLSDLFGAIGEIRGLLLVAGLAGILFAAALSVIISHMLSRTLRSLVGYAQKMVSHQDASRIHVESADEIGWLAGSFNRLADQLEQQLETLAHERDQFEAVLEGMGEAVLALDEEGRVTLINKAGIMLLGLKGKPIGGTLLEAVRNPALHELVTRAGEVGEASVELDFVGDAPRKILARASRRMSGGVVIVLLDVTERRRLESLRRDFVANVSHELRTPVSVIQANAETLLDGALEEIETAERFLHSIVANTGRLSSLISDLLDLSRIEEGKYDLAPESIRIGSSFEKVSVALETTAAEKSISIIIDEESSRTEAFADGRALEQVLFNLVDNAVKYTPRGGTVCLRTFSTEKLVRVEVADDGPGIAAEHRGRLFERFYRVDKGRSREKGGTGLGLAIVKHLITAMGGTVGVEHGSEKGSVFWFTLPAR